MEPKENRQYTAFANIKKVAQGNILDVALKVKKILKTDAKTQVLIFDSITSQQIEIDFRGTSENLARRLDALVGKTAPTSEEEKKIGPGRPRLGVISKEITLLPNHWEWLSSQPGGASVTLRRLVEEAKKKNYGKDLIRQAQESGYKFMTTMAGDLPNYEDALRALYSGEKKKFEKLIFAWPKDIKEHLLSLVQVCLRLP